MNRDSTITVRIARPGLDALDAWAADEGRSRSDIVRRILADAIATRRHATPRASRPAAPAPQPPTPDDLDTIA